MLCAGFWLEPDCQSNTSQTVNQKASHARKRGLYVPLRHGVFILFNSCYTEHRVHGVQGRVQIDMLVGCGEDQKKHRTESRKVEKKSRNCFVSPCTSFALLFLLRLFSHVRELTPRRRKKLKTFSLQGCCCKSESEGEEGGGREQRRNAVRQKEEMHCGREK